MKFTIEYFIAKFEAIPHNKWCRFTLDDGHGCKCAMGHCGATVGEPELVSGEPFRELINTEESSALLSLFHERGFCIGEVNDNKMKLDPHHFSGISSPRGRVLAALKYFQTNPK